MPQINQLVGPYKLIKKLGQGGFGEVWLAEKQTKFVTKKLAVKLPLKDQVDTDAVRHEATLWEQASGHPNILPIIDADEYDGQIVIVSEYAPDGSLADLLKLQGRLSVEKAVEIIDGILAGLEFLHSRNIIHRDLKPDNVLLQGETPRLADFGISRVLRTTMTSSSVNLAGTPYYMAPECFDKKRNEQTDIWAVGVILYEILAEKRPFEDDNLINLVSSIATKEPESLPDNVPTWLNDVIRKALAKASENRYKTVNEMRSHIRQLAKTPEKQEPVVLPEPQDDEAKTEPYDDLSITTLQINKKENKFWKIGTVALSAVLLSGIGGAIYLNQPNGQTSQNINDNSQNTIVQTTNKTMPSNSNSENTANNASNSTNNLPSTANTNNSSNSVENIKPSPNKKQLSQVMDRYIDRIAAANGNVEGAGNKKILYGDIDGDGDEDVAVQFVLSFPGGNMWGISVAIFRNNGGLFEGITDETVGGKTWRDFEIKSITKGKITALVASCDPICTGSLDVKRQRQIIIPFINNKLIVSDKP